MERTILATLFTAALAVSTAGCGSDDHAPDPSVASLALRMEPAPQGAESSCAQQDGACECPHGATARLTLVATDSAGNEVAIDPNAIEWSSTDAATVGVRADGSGGAGIDAKRDWFDVQGSEPSSTVTASYGSLRASLPVTVIIDAHGDWRAELDNGFTYTLSLTQTGRSVVDRATHYGGRIADDALSLAVSGVTVNARFISRTEARGTYAGSGGLAGTLTCTKL